MDRSQRIEMRQQQSHLEKQNGPPPSDDAMRALCVVEEKTSISFAYFDELTGTLILETSACFGFDTGEVIDSFKNSVETPNLILVSTRIADNGPLLEIIVRASSTSSNATASASGLPPPGTSSTESLDESDMIPYKVLKTSNFDLGVCQQLITTKLHVKEQSRDQEAARVSSNAVSFPTHFDEKANSTAAGSYRIVMGQERSFHSLATLIDFNSSSEVRAVGGLMSYLQSTLFRLTENNIVTINRVTNSPPSSYLRVTPLALRALHIFNEEQHPLIAKGTGGTKEGFSLYSLLNRCSSKLGSRCMRQWMLRPLTSVQSIKLRQSGIELLMMVELGSIVQQLSIFFSKISDIPNIMTRMQKCQTVPVDFVSLKNSVDAAIQVHGIINGDVKRAGGRTSEAFISHITNLINPRCLIEISRRIEATIDLEMTKQTKEICINDGFSADLDNAKMRFDELDDVLSRVGVTVAQRARQLGQLQVIFLPQVGFLVCVQKATAPSSFVPPNDFEFTFEEAECMYFKSTEMFVLDDQEGDLDALIKDTESFLAAELEEDIIEYDLSLRNTFRGLSELDCILSLSIAAAELNFCKPEVVDDERVILIENGRSPLQEIVTEHKYIPNDTAVTAEHPIAMITGSNYSGKSCYMNQVGVILFLAQIGSYVPATKAKVGIADKILVRITSVETCSLPQSTFQIDLSQMGSILRQATNKSLVLIDEFGKGTSPASGIALLAAAIEQLSITRCRTMCTTHLLELFSLGILKQDRGGINLFKMGVHIPEDKDEDAGNAVPLFKLEKGVASSSDGLVCAKMAGLRPDVLGRSEELLDAIKAGKSVSRLDSVSHTVQDEGTISLLTEFLENEAWASASEEDIHSFIKMVEGAVLVGGG